MRQMKDSGVEWIGEIPKDWNVRCIKDAYAFQTGWTPDTHDDSNFIGDNVWVNISDIKERVIFDSARHISDSAIESASMSISPKGSLMYAFKLSVGAVAFCGVDMYTNEAIATFLKGDNSLEYLYYLAPLFIIKNANENIYGAKILNQQLIRNAKIVLPPVEEQIRLASYLDSRCSQIDSIIEKQEAIIEKLKEYKLSVITEAVTKGLDPNVEMKDSGVEWLGLYPSHWDYLSFKNVLIERMEKNDPIQTDERLSLSIDKGVTLYSDKTTNLDRFKDDVSQYKLAHEGDLVLNSMNMIVGAIGISNWFGCVSPAYYTYYDHEEDHITARYCDYLLRCKTMRKVLFSLGKGIMAIDRGDDRVNTCRLKVSRTDLRALKIPVPPVDEQRRIVSYLMNKEQSIDKTIADREKSIEVLKHYKTSLIYEVVTGKKEV